MFSFVIVFGIVSKQKNSPQNWVFKLWVPRCRFFSSNTFEHSFQFWSLLCFSKRFISQLFGLSRSDALFAQCYVNQKVPELESSKINFGIQGKYGISERNNKPILNNNSCLLNHCQERQKKLLTLGIRRLSDAFACGSKIVRDM